MKIFQDLKHFRFQVFSVKCVKRHSFLLFLLYSPMRWAPLCRLGCCGVCWCHYHCRLQSSAPLGPSQHLPMTSCLQSCPCKSALSLGSLPWILRWGSTIPNAPFVMSWIPRTLQLTSYTTASACLWRWLLPRTKHQPQIRVKGGVCQADRDIVP